VLSVMVSVRDPPSRLRASMARPSWTPSIGWRRTPVTVTSSIVPPALKNSMPTNPALALPRPAPSTVRPRIVTPEVACT
jgi:hypothetical protein